MREPKLCKRCNKPVVVNSDNYDIYENMHWICFHLEFEHQGDPDAACEDPGCPWWHIDVLAEKLRQLGYDPMAEIDKAVKKRWGR